MLKVERILAVAAAVAAVAVALPASAQVGTEGKAVAIDGDAALALARRESCLKCHAVDKKKEGPAYKQVALKYKNDPQAEEKLFRHVKSGRLVRIGDDEEEHRIIKTTDEAAIRNLLQWILSQ